MRKYLLFLSVIICVSSYGQTNTFPADGNVGIGTTGPTYKLDVYGAAFISGHAANIDGRPLTPLQNTGKVLIAWNRSAGEGETNFIANRGAGNVGGFSFSDYSNVGILTNLMKISGNGNVGIGTTNPQSKLAVNGIITTQEVNVTTTGWADYVFDSSYELKSLTAVANYVKQNKHLPNIPSAEEVGKNGIALGEMNKKFLEKIEELTLYVIKQNEEIKELKTVKEESRQQKELIEKLQQRLEKLESKK